MRNLRVVALVVPALVCGCSDDETQATSTPLVDGGGASNATGGAGNGGANASGGGGSGAVASSTGGAAGTGGRATGGSATGGNAGTDGTSGSGGSGGASGSGGVSGSSGASGSGGVSNPGDAGTCPVSSDLCIACIHDRCCAEYLACNDIRCAGASRLGEFACMERCLVNAPQTGATLADCADSCKEGAVLAPNTANLIACMTSASPDGGTGCALPCFGFVP